MLVRVECYRVIGLNCTNQKPKARKQYSTLWVNAKGSMTISNGFVDDKIANDDTVRIELTASEAMDALAKNRLRDLVVHC